MERQDFPRKQQNKLRPALQYDGLSYWLTTAAAAAVQWLYVCV